MPSLSLGALRALSPTPLKPKAAPRVVIILVVIALQAVGISALSQAIGAHAQLPTSHETLVTAFIQPRIREDYDQPPGQDLSRLAALMRILRSNRSRHIAVARGGLALEPIRDPRQLERRGLRHGRVMIKTRIGTEGHIPV